MKVFLQILLIFAVFILGPIAWLNKNGLHVERTIPGSSIWLREGASYATELQFNPFFSGSSRDSDSEETPTRSELRLTENGKELGPAHSLHADIASKGHGRFSNWQNGLIFSSSDGSDPRYNHRAYAVSYTEYPTPTLYGTIFASSGLLALLFATSMQLRAFMQKVRTWNALTPAHYRWKFQENLFQVLQKVSSFFVPASLIHLAFLIFIYTAAVLALYTAVVAEKTDTGAVKVNFEYRVF